MNKKTLDRVKQIARLLPNQEDAALLSGVTLAAWRIYQELRLTTPDTPIRAGEIQQALIRKHGYAADPENIRAIIRALREGGVPVQSARSRGYWLE